MPSGAPDFPYHPNDDHLPVLSSATSNTFVSYLRSQQLFYCPSFAEQFKHDTSRQQEARGYGFVIGYNYHGGHVNTPWPGIDGHTNTWLSPQRLTDSGSLIIISEMNDWSYGDGRVWAPHGKNGPILTKNDPSNQGYGPKRTSADIGAAGGNLGLLEGSASWKKIAQKGGFIAGRSSVAKLVASACGRELPHGFSRSSVAEERGMKLL